MMPVEVVPPEFGLVVVTAFFLAFIASRTGQPTIMAYIVAGLVLGPVGFGLVGDSPMLDAVSELGLPLLLFLVGLEMKFDAFRSILTAVGKITALQIAAQQFLAFCIAYILGFGLFESFILSLCTIFGATPVVVKMLTDKKESSTTAGRIDIGTLILQDIFLVFVLAFLAAGELSAGEIPRTLGKILLLSGLIGVLSFSGSKLLERRVLGDIAERKEAFFIQTVAWLFFFVALSDFLGLSKEIGGFLAGLGLGQLPYSTELTEKVRPVTNFFIMIFFVGIGLTLDSQQLFLYWKEALIAMVFLSVSAFFVMYLLIRWQGFSAETGFKGAINLTMVSEFSLVAGALAVENGLITAGMLGYLTLMKLATNGYATYLIKYNDQLYRRFKPYLSGDKEDPEDHERKYDAVILGNSKFDEVVRPVIDEKFSSPVFVESDPHEMRNLEKEGENFIFGDPRHPEIRRDADITRADVVISLEEEFELDRQLAEELDVPFITLASDREEAEKLERAGAHHVILEEYGVEKIFEQKVGELIE